MTLVLKVPTLKKIDEVDNILNIIFGADDDDDDEWRVDEL